MKKDRLTSERERERQRERKNRERERGKQKRTKSDPPPLKQFLLSANTSDCWSKLSSFSTLGDFYTISHH